MSTAEILTSKPEFVYRDDATEVWCGDALNPEHVGEIMGDRVANLLCVDAPYSEKTHAGHKAGKLTADRAAGFARTSPDSPEGRYAATHYANADLASAARNDLDYPAWAPVDVDNFVALWSRYFAGWRVSITDDVLAPHWGTAFEVEGLYRFAPVPLVETGSRVRMAGDGPSGWTCWLVVARPKSREFASWGTLPGAYIQPAERDINSTGGSDRIVGGKPLKSMCAIVADYSRRGDLLVDPCCGGGTTLLAAKMQGRKSIGIEKDRGRAELAGRRLAKKKEQTNLFEKAVCT